VWSIQNETIHGTSPALRDAADHDSSTWPVRASVPEPMPPVIR
jgi:hypothetical protein